MQLLRIKDPYLLESGELHSPSWPRTSDCECSAECAYCAERVNTRYPYEIPWGWCAVDLSGLPSWQDKARSVTLATSWSHGWNIHSVVKSTEGFGGRLSFVLALFDRVGDPLSLV